MALANMMQGLGSKMFPQGGQGFGQAVGAASPLLLSMAAGLRSGDPYSQMPLGLALMEQMREKRQQQAQQAEAGELFKGTFGGIAGAPTGFTGAGVPSGVPTASTQGAAGPSIPPTASATRYDAMFGPLEQKFQLPSGYLARTAQIESSGDPAAANPKSSARGLFQFTEGTAKQYGVNPMDARSSTVGAARLAADNASHLRQELGREPSAQELYLAHQQGAGGAAKLLKNPNAKAVDVVGRDAVVLNGGNENMTAMEFADLWLSKFGGGDPMQDQQVQRLMQVSAHPGMSDAQRQVIQTALQTRISQITDQQMTPYQAATLGMQQAEAQQPVAPEDRYREVGGRLVDLYAQGGPETVIGPQGADPMSTIGKLAADLRDGRISQEEYDVALQNMAPKNMTIETNPDGTFRMVQGTNPVGRPLTEGQSKDNVYATRATGALPDLEQYGNALTSWWQRRTDDAPLDLGRFAQSPEYQMGMNSGLEFLQAILRKDTGAAITEAEQKEYGKVYLPQPGDTPEVLERKREARLRAVNALKSGMSAEQILSVERANQQTDEQMGASEIPQSALDAGIDPDLWQFMTPEEQHLWQN